MFILGIQGSPRKKGNSRWLLNQFLAQCESLGAATHIIDTCKEDIRPCRELVVCEKKGYCPIKDDMGARYYGLIKKADIVVLASPIFFYSVSAQIKTFIDRCQMFWGRKYKLGLKDPLAGHRKGFFLGIGASGGTRLFDGAHLVAKYFFDAISAEYQGHLTYKKVEGPQEIKSHPTVRQDMETAAETLCRPFMEKKKLIFVSQRNALRSQVAAALAKTLADGRIKVDSFGIQPASFVMPSFFKACEQKKIDLMYEKPQTPDELHLSGPPDCLVGIGEDIAADDLPWPADRIWPVKGYTDTDPGPREAARLFDRMRPDVEAILSTLLKNTDE